ncbi:MAG TPA: flagellar export chaperone FliS [Deltaproteobacteria bacterium]|jgi:flagellar protein FliS|nr:flagellar export chaperone FliS [Deltaproteobacteria bacterium]
MVQTQASNIYHRTAIETAEPIQLIILCYDAAINDLKRAAELHERREMNEAYRKIRHAQDIITELLVDLDYERGGDIARSLNRLYNFILRQLIGINSREDTSIYDHLVRILSELRDGWEAIRLSPSQTPVKVGLLPRNWQASA